MGTKILRLIAVAEVAGAAGLLLPMLPDVPGLFRLGPGWGKALAVLGLLAGLAVLTIVAGVQLWRLRPSGWVLSLVSQAVQLPYLALPGFAWRLSMGPAGSVAFDPDTADVELEGTLMSVGIRFVAAKSTEPTLLGFNLVAAFFMAYLLRSLWHRHREAQARARGDTLPPPAPLGSRLLRGARMTLAAGVAIVVLPALAFWIYNRIDEAPTPAAQRWYAPLVHQVPDSENAWLALLGQGAAEGEDPIHFGRRRLQAYEARVAGGGALGQPSADEKALEDDPLPLVSTDGQGQKLDLTCDASRHNCLDWARDRAAALTRLEAANTTRLRRFEQLIGLPGFADLSTPAASSPVPGLGIDDRLYGALILRDLGQPARRADALARLQRVTVFWRRVLASTDDLTVKVITLRILERYLRVVDALLDRGDGSLPPAAMALLAEATTAERDWVPAYRRHLLTEDHTLEVLTRWPLHPRRQCEKNCLLVWLSGQLYLRQATRNQAARLWDGVMAEHQADPRDWEAGRQRIAALVQDIDPNQGNWRELLDKLKHNTAGRAMVVRSQPDHGSSLSLQHDLENLRRLLRLKQAARQRGLPAEQMRGFLRAQPPQLRNVFTGQAFEWHGASQVLRFEPKSGRWTQPHLVVRYPSP
jgi:hypothetical protein